MVDVSGGVKSESVALIVVTVVLSSHDVSTTIEKVMVSSLKYLDLQ